MEAIAGAFLKWCEKRLGHPAEGLRIAVGRDSRISGPRILEALKRVFIRYGVQGLDCGLASTPSMFMAVKNLPCHCSVQITASHHPFYRNGLKFFTEEGGLDSPDISEILAYAQQGLRPEKECPGAWKGVCHMKTYAQGLREQIKREVNGEDYDYPLQGLHIVVDAGNGAGGFYAGEDRKSVV